MSITYWYFTNPDGSPWALARIRDEAYPEVWVRHTNRWVWSKALWSLTDAFSSEPGRKAVREEQISELQRLVPDPPRNPHSDQVRVDILDRRFSKMTSLVQIGEIVASTAHTGETDKAGLPYFTHPARVATAMRSDGHDDVHQAVAYLHDVAEDTGLDIVELRRLFLGTSSVDRGAAERVIAALDAITHRPNEPRETYYQRVRQDPVALAVKTYDIADNTDVERLALLDAATRSRLVEKYAKARHLLGIN